MAITRSSGGLVLGFREGGGFGFVAHAAPIAASSPVPEPSAALLFLIGGAAIATRIKQRN